jgi:hypothetical protein
MIKTIIGDKEGGGEEIKERELRSKYSMLGERKERLTRIINLSF